MGTYAEHREYQVAYQRAYKRRKISYMLTFKDRPCADCGLQFPPPAMEFDHLEAKSFGLADAGSWPIARIAAEVAKCDVVCSNCHRIRTWNRRHPGAPYGVGRLKLVAT